MSSLINKVKEAVSSDKKDNTTTHDTHTTHTQSAAAPRTDNTWEATAPGPNAGRTGEYTTSDNYALGGENRGTDGVAKKTDGPHKSDLLNKLDPRVDSDRDHSKNAGMNPQGSATTGKDHPGHTTTGQHGAHGAHHSGVAATGPASTTAGPHSSNVANKADPRVDSDLDGGRHAGLNQPGYNTGATHGTHGTHGAPGVHHSGVAGTGPATSTAGPHSSNVANKADPRVDSDLDGGRHGGFNQHGTAGTVGTTGGAGNTAYGAGGVNTMATGPASNTAGPHSSNMANKLDPRVDSDLDSSRRTDAGAGAGMHQHSTQPVKSNMVDDADPNAPTGRHAGVAGQPGAQNAAFFNSGTGPASSTAGPHSSNIANKADPRVDSDLDGGRHAGLNQPGHSAGTTHATHGTTHATHGTHQAGVVGTGPASTTAGPHGSNIANKADPRVDSDLDGGRHAGLNQPGHTTGTTHATHGAHGSNIASHPANTGVAAPGPAPNTAGPHKSDMLNKMDPRVDSDMSKAAPAGQQIHDQQAPIQGQHGAHAGQQAPIQGQHGVHGGQQIHGQQAPIQGQHGQQIPGQQAPIQGQQVPGQQIPGQQIPGQQIPGQQMPGQFSDERRF